MTPTERRAKHKRNRDRKMRRLGIDLPEKTKPNPKQRRKRPADNNKHLWVTEPVCPLEKIRVASGEVDGLHWLRMEAERWGAGVEIKPVHDGKMVLAKKGVDARR